MEQFGDDFFCYATIPLPFTLASYLRKVDFLMKDLIRQPESAHELLEFATEVLVDVAKLYASLGVHGLFVCDPLPPVTLSLRNTTPSSRPPPPGV